MCSINFFHNLTTDYNNPHDMIGIRTYMLEEYHMFLKQTPRTSCVCPLYSRGFLVHSLLTWWQQREKEISNYNIVDLFTHLNVLRAIINSGTSETSLPMVVVKDKQMCEMFQLTFSVLNGDSSTAPPFIRQHI